MDAKTAAYFKKIYPGNYGSQYITAFTKTEKQYYTSYYDVFGDVATGDNSLFNDYGQLYNGRQGFKWDFNPKLTERYTYKNLNKQHKYNN